MAPKEVSMAQAERSVPEGVRPDRVRDDSFPMRSWGLAGERELDRVVIVSPHLDDAVLSCARFMAVHPGVTVVTVFAGNPAAYPEPMRLWDVQCGFGPADDVMEARRREDRAALALLDATPVHLDFIEHSYNPGDQPVAPEVIAGGLVAALRELEPTLVLAPFGLANPDHDVTHRACMVARDEIDPSASWWCYEDNGYKHIPGMLAWRVSSLFRRRLWPTPVCPATDHHGDRKAAAVACYPSQLLALEDDWQIGAKLAAPAPEQFWRLAPPPAGWEGIAGS
jgi:LmbE family N-acetylglucosaminyl deacetylase